MKVLVPTYCMNGESCIGQKRIYAKNLTLAWHCPDCKKFVVSRFDEVPFTSNTGYCHVFYCDDCGNESSEKMYKVEQVMDSSCIVTLSGLNQLRAYKEVTNYVELKPMVEVGDSK